MHPADVLSCAIQISSEMDTILASTESTHDKFLSSWSKYESAIIQYAVSSKNKSAALKKALRDIDGNPGKS